MPKIFNRGLFTKHITATPSLPVALQSSGTQVILAYFPPEISSTQKNAAIAHLKKFEEGLKSFSGIGALSYGWGVENDFPIRGLQENQRASILMCFIGFDNVDAQRTFRETEAFEKLSRLIRSMQGIIKLETFSVCFLSLSRNTTMEKIGDV
jgi:hypothetical protein